MSFRAFGDFGRFVLGKWPAGVSLSGKLVLLALVSRHNQETGRCDPSVQTIAKDMGLSERAVRDGLRSLEEAKLIVTEHRQQRKGRGVRQLNNRYRLSLLGGAKFAAGMGQDLPSNLEIGTLSAWDDLVTLIEEPMEASEGASQDDGILVTNTQSLARRSKP